MLARSRQLQRIFGLLEPFLHGQIWCQITVYMFCMLNLDFSPMPHSKPLYLRHKLVPGVWPDCNKTFDGGQGSFQERLTLELAQSVKVQVIKGQEI